jgi:thymidylate synthase
MKLNKPAEFDSLDDLLNATYTDILKNGVSINSKRGANIEITQFAATLLNPRIRTSMSLDRKLVKSKFAEFAWYLSKDEDKDFITPYIPLYGKEEQRDNRILGAYGPKIFKSTEDSKSQFERVIEQLVKRRTTKQAYIAISDARDYKFRDQEFSSPPCTIGLHFYVRNDKLSLVVYMRSNDAYLGLPHDLFCFTMLQELVALKTNLELGTYTHYATSMHAYEKDADKISNYLAEGLQEPIEMPLMVEGSEKMLDLVSAEFDPRTDQSHFQDLDDYWKDFSLFSIKQVKSNPDQNRWTDKFSDKKMKLIAKNSITQ